MAPVTNKQFNGFFEKFNNASPETGMVRANNFLPI